MNPFKIGPICRSLGAILLFISTFAVAQEASEITKWNVQLSKPTAKPGEVVDIIFSATIEDAWKLYSSDFASDIGPLPTEFNFDKATSYALVGSIQAINPKKTVDPAWDQPYTYFAKKAEFRQKIKVLSSGYRVTGTIKGLLCSTKNGLCIPFSEAFKTGAQGL
ncbi:protein-disulfide reductase DsbD domain-containing protein [Larkinella sp.]|uniref:protein-disulfide reductase DsbD domain-containing protein n=1 Tax=Larkinella sp. TaxID=2034517 RepID=UPI003BA965D7